MQIDSPLNEREIAYKVQSTQNFGQLCAIFGYAHEEHTVITDDGYLLMLHRLVKQIEPTSASTRRSHKKPVVYLQHGLLTNSELFMLVTHQKKCLPIVLAEHGYDVWLGNNRGNKYSQNHVSRKVNSSEFWDFCIDDFARHDIPTSIDYVLNFTNRTKLVYIGFSQGTAQTFAALSIHPELNDKIEVFIALGPIMLPSGYSSYIIDFLIKRNPSVLYQLFGRRSIFPAVSFLQTMLPSYILHKCVDIALVHLFQAYSRNITQLQKIAAYPHIYCSSSVKAVVHWAQIMRNSVFSLYESSISGTGASTTDTPTLYPTQDIKTRMVLIYGDKDTLFDLDTVLKHLPHSRVTTFRLVNYEHLDVLWGGNVHNDVIPRVLEALPNDSSECFPDILI